MQRFRNTFSVQFYCRKSKAKAGLAPIEAGVKTSLHFHLARHYYCHMLLNKYKVAYDVAAKMMGHNQIKMTMHYGKLWNSTVMDEFRKCASNKI